MIEWALIFFGVFIALAVYVQVISRFNEASDRMRRAEIVNATAAGEEEKKEAKKDEEGLKRRFCPLCKSELKKHESIYAEFHEAEPRPRVIIHGCRYCYAPSGLKTPFSVRQTSKGENNEEHH